MLTFRRILFLFFISGLTALIFEVAWARQMCLLFGNTTLASASVIAAYMTGLAIGSFAFGKIADSMQKQSIRLYGLLEGGIGIFALLFPLLTVALFPLYKQIYLNFYQDFLKISVIRFALSFAVLLIPTVLMGGTFPLLSRFLARDPRLMNANISRLYSMNLFGAMTGSFISGFLLIGMFGLYKSCVIAGLLNLGIFFYVFSALRKEETPVVTNRSSALPEPVPSEVSAPLRIKEIALVVFVMVVHGFCAFVIQICWTRTMALVLGSSTYSFSAVLTTFLAGLGLGTYAVSLLVKRGIRISLTAIGFMELAVGASVLVFIPMFEWLIYYTVKLFPFISLSILFVFAVQFIFCAAAMIIPTFLMGLVYPAVLSFLGRPKDIGKIVGFTYAANTAGGVAGSFLAAFYFISHFGINGSLRLASILSIAAGIVVIAAASQRPRFGTNVRRAAMASVLSGLFLFYPWDKNLFSSGAFIYAYHWQEKIKLGKQEFQKAMNAGSDLLFYKDGISSTISVLQHDIYGSKSGFKAKSIRVNGKTDASTIGDMATQLYLGYIPLFAHPEPKEVLVIGLGTGVTLGTVTQFPSVQNIECVEIEPAVIEANRFFAAENHYALKDPRVKLIVGDGRNHISFSPKKYDVIISEPSNPWIAGVSNLFTRENYRLALDKLNDDGIYCQWFHSYQMSKGDFVMIMKTFASVFPQVNLFRVGGNDYFLLGSRQKIAFNYEKMAHVIANNKIIGSDLKFFTEHQDHFVLGSFMLSNRDLREALSKEKARLNTDDHLYLEYSAPRHLYQSTGELIFRWLHSIKRRDLFPEFFGWEKEKILSSPGIWKIFFTNGLNAMVAKNADDAIYFLSEAARLNPGDLGIHFLLGQVYESKKQYSEAVVHYTLALGSEKLKERVENAIRRATLRQKMDENPILHRNVVLHNMIGNLSFFMGDVDEAISSLKLAVDIDPTYSKNYIDLAAFYSLRGYETEGLQMIRKAEQLDPDNPLLKKAKKLWHAVSRDKRIRERLKEGRVYLSIKDYAQAKRFFESIIKDDPSNFFAYAFLAESETGLGLVDAAKRHQEQAVELRKQYEEKVESSALNSISKT